MDINDIKLFDNFALFLAVACLPGLRWVGSCLFGKTCVGSGSVQQIGPMSISDPHL